MELRPLGATGLNVSPIALGCWPLAGMSTPLVDPKESLATIEACFDLGINFLDTAYCYGADGESERLIARALAGRRNQMVIATKGGIQWGPDRKQIVDGSPATLRRQCEESLRRLETDRVELYYLHAPDPKTPIAESAGQIRRFIDEGKVLAAGVSNVDRVQLEAFAAECPLSAFQPPYNMLQRGIEADTLPWCRERRVATAVYWPLLKGLLAGKLSRDHVFAAGDTRLKYPMFHGDEWQKNLDLVDALRRVAEAAGRSVAQVVLNWTIHQPGITAALSGAKRPDQIRDNAGALGWRLTADELGQINSALAVRGKAVLRRAV